jgi:hypothetical protein
MGGPSPEKGLGNRRQLQVDTTPNRQKTILHQMLADSSFAVNRTVVKPDNKFVDPNTDSQILFKAGARRAQAPLYADPRVSMAAPRCCERHRFCRI